jgi:hypothetical protein
MHNYICFNLLCEINLVKLLRDILQCFLSDVIRLYFISLRALSEIALRDIKEDHISFINKK